MEVSISREEHITKRDLLQLGDPSIFTCPDCHGVLLQLKRSKVLRFRCHTGHGFTALTLLSHLNSEIETNLWTTIRSMEEAVLLLNHIAKHSHMSATHTEFAGILDRNAQALEERAVILRRLAMENDSLPLDPAESPTITIEPETS